MELLFSLLLELVLLLSTLGLVFSLYIIFMGLDILIGLFNALGLLAKLLVWLFGPRAATATEGGRGPRANGKWPRRILLIGTAILVVFLATVYVANRWYFEPVTRWSLGHLEKRAGIKVDFAEVTGSFWTGKFDFRRLTARRAEHEKSRFDLSIDSLALNVSMWDLAWRKVVFDSLAIGGVRGEWEQVSRSDKLKPRRFFRLNMFSVDDATIRYTNRAIGPQPFAVNLRIDTLRSPHLGSDWFLYDLLFHTNLAGAVDDTRFRIMTSGELGEQFENIWICDGLPIPLVAQVVGTPLDWFEKGDIDVHVENRFRFASGGDHEALMRWSIVFRDFHARAPEGSSLKARAVAKPLLFFVNRKSERLDLSFEWMLNKNEFRYASSADLGDLVRAALGRKTLETLKKLGRGGEDGETEESQK